MDFKFQYALNNVKYAITVKHYFPSIFKQNNVYVASGVSLRANIMRFVIVSGTHKKLCYQKVNGDAYYWG